MVPRRQRGDWVAEVPGYGRLAVVHSDATRSNFAKGTYRDSFDARSRACARYRAFRAALASNPDVVLVQWDAPRNSEEKPFVSNGYVGIFRIADLAWSGNGETVTFRHVGRETVAF